MTVLRKYKSRTVNRYLNRTGGVSAHKDSGRETSAIEIFDMHVFVENLCMASVSREWRPVRALTSD